MRALCLLAFIFLLGCTSQVPQDFMLQYGFGSCNMSWGWTQISLDATGKLLVEISGNGGTIERKYHFPEEKVLELARAISENNFTSLSPRYINPYVVGGMCTGMFARLNGTESKVEVANTPVPAVAKISEKLLTILDGIDSDWAKLNIEI